ncbi:MAG: hypothetical protein OEZ43_13615 [Gammaproteobacteria bacterium]|nr:hypothetical protein [Gammaproteobacteria bacterium]
MTSPKLLDTYMPVYQFCEYHAIAIACDKATAYQAIRTLDFSDSLTIRLLFLLRGMPTSDMRLLGFLQKVNFTLMRELPDQELLIGFKARYMPEIVVDVDGFPLDESCPIKMTWNFLVAEAEDGRVIVSTETRAWCRSRMTRMTFWPYWILVRPFSGLIRRIMLRKIRQSAQSNRQDTQPC